MHNLWLIESSFLTRGLYTRLYIFLRELDFGSNLWHFYWLESRLKLVKVKAIYTFICPNILKALLTICFLFEDFFGLRFDLIRFFISGVFRLGMSRNRNWKWNSQHTADCLKFTAFALMTFAARQLLGLNSFEIH